MPQPSERPTEAERRASRVEGVIALISAAAVLAILGVLVFEATRDDSASVDLIVTETESDHPAGQLRFKLTNRGTRTAASVTVALTLRDADAIVDKRTVVVDYVAANSRATGAFILGERDDELMPALSVESYLDP